MERRLCISLALAAVLGLGLLPVSAAPAALPPLPPDPASSQSDLCHRGKITIDPPAPTSIDPVSIVVSGWWGSSCPQTTYAPRRTANTITLSITVTDLIADPPVACLEVVTAWAITHELGTLSPGEYTVQADCSAGACWSFQAWTTFRVWAPTGMYWIYLPALLRTEFDNCAP